MNNFKIGNASFDMMGGGADFNVLGGFSQRKQQNQPYKLINQVKNQQGEIQNFATKYNWRVEEEADPFPSLNHYNSVTQMNKDWRNYPASLQGEIAGVPSRLTYIICSSEQRHEREVNNRKEVYYTYSHAPFTVLSTKIDDTKEPWISGVFIEKKASLMSNFVSKFLTLLISSVFVGGISYAAFTMGAEFLASEEKQLMGFFPFLVIGLIILAIGVFLWNLAIGVFLWKKHRKDPQRLVKQRMEFGEFNRKFIIKAAQASSKTRLREFFSPAQQTKMVDQDFSCHIEIVDGYILHYVPKFIFGTEADKMFKDASMTIQRYQKELGEYQSMNIQYQDTEIASTEESLFTEPVLPTQEASIPEQPRSPSSELKAASLDEIMARFNKE